MKLTATLLLLALALLSQTQLGLRSLRGPAVWIRDAPAGNDILVNLDPATMAIDPPTTAGGRPTLRAIAPAAQPASLREKLIQVIYAGVPFTLPDTPLPNTVVKLSWGTQQIPGIDYSVSGRVVTMIGAAWEPGDPLLVTYFY